MAELSSQSSDYSVLMDAGLGELISICYDHCPDPPKKYIAFYILNTAF